MTKIKDKEKRKKNNYLRKDLTPQGYEGQHSNAEHYRYVHVETLKYFCRKKRLMDLKNYLVLSDAAAGRGWLFIPEAIEVLKKSTGASEKTCKNALRRLSANGIITGGKNNTFAILGKGRLNEMIGGTSRLQIQVEKSSYNQTDKKVFYNQVRYLLAEQKQQQLRYQELRHAKESSLAGFAVQGQSYHLMGLKAELAQPLSPMDIGVATSLLKSELGVSAGTISAMKASMPNHFKVVKKYFLTCKDEHEMHEFFKASQHYPDINHVRHKETQDMDGNEYIDLFMRYPDVCTIPSARARKRVSKHKTHFSGEPIELSTFFTSITKPVTSDVLQKERRRRLELLKDSNKCPDYLHYKQP